MSELISVIVPVYNMEKYLNKCVNSILEQTYKNLEIILVDDGSKDSSGDMLDDLGKKDARIKVIHKPNGGLSDARNAGLDIMTGRYLTFVDSDDHIEKDYVERLYTALKKNDADISAGGIRLVFEDDEAEDTAELSGENSEATFTRYEAVRRALKMSINQGAWGKLYKSELFSSIRYPKGKIYEDIAIWYRLLISSDKVTVFDHKIYNYLIRSGSIMRSEFNGKQLDEIEAVDEEMDYTESVYPELRNLTSARRIYSYLSVLKKMSKCKDRDKYKDRVKALRKRCIELSRGLLADSEVPLTMKIKIMAIRCGTPVFLMVQSVADMRNPEISHKSLKRK
ncbi:MAG: glycosyltransferase [Ruminococcus sp.]|nr:glycosyltransferase [Ruminococcus sp.]